MTTDNTNQTVAALAKAVNDGAEKAASFIHAWMRAVAAAVVVEGSATDTEEHE